MESFWEGPEQTIETLFDIDGTFHPCFITDREFDKTEGYALETGLRHPSVLPAQIQSEMYRMAQEVAQALGISIGAAKYDCILTPDGPRIIEMTVRLSGGFDCQYLVPAATGKNIIKAAILTAIGQLFDVSLLAAQQDHVAVSRSLWPSPGRIKRVVGLEEARSIPGVRKIILRKQAGDLIEPYTDCTKRACFIIASAPSQEELEILMRQVNATLQLEMEPV
jgi:biotin carboxylase